jgi:RNA polymerase sigma-70 factor (ECF subfamily)
VTEGSAPAEQFEQHRRLLFTVAYDLLGSASDAEDVVQDAWLRWSGADRGDVLNPRAYLVTVTTRLALNRLRDTRARREAYVGPWLPEPLLTAPDVAQEAELAEAVSLALLVVLETLGPVERAVFVLREVFGLPYAEIAQALERSEAAVRQVAHRAREHVQARRPRFDTDRAVQRQVTDRFLAACTGGDVDALIAMMSPGVTLVTDGGGRMKAALRPITGAEKVARFMLAVSASTAQELAAVDGVRTELCDVNGRPAMVVFLGDEPWTALQVHVADGLIERIDTFRNPDKLTGLRTDARITVT